jgi:DNA helicase HerA-like ATPase
MKQIEFPFDIEEAQRSGTSIFGMPGSGKTNLAKLCVRKLLRAGVIVFVFDPSEAWTIEGPIKKVIKVFNTNLDVDIPHESVVFDMKTLYVEQQQVFVQNITKKIFMEYVEQERGKRESLILLFEESQLYIPQGKMRAKVAQELLRLVMVGRNFRLRLILVAQFPANVDKTAVKACGQKYMGFTDEENDIRYLSGWMRGREEELAELDVGEFFYRYKKTLSRMRLPEFKSKIKPISIIPTIKNIPSSGRKTYMFLITKTSKTAMFVGVLFGIVIAVAILIGLTQLLL